MMAVPHHTHQFELPVATRADMAVGIATDKIVVPANLGSAALEDISAFATSTQGARADGAALIADLGLLAYKDTITVEDIEADGVRDGDHILYGDGQWRLPPVGGGSSVQGNMHKSVYDPAGIEADIFNMDHMIEGVTNKLYQAADKARLAASLQADDVGLLAYKNKIGIGDIEADGVADATVFLRGDGMWVAPSMNSGDGGNSGGGGGSGGGEIMFYENLIINGNFTVDQRRGQGTMELGSWAYDRWRNVVGGRQQIVEALSAGDYALFWDGGGIAQIGTVTGASPLVASLDGGNIAVRVPIGAHNIALIRLKGEVPATNPCEARPFAQELQLCQRYYQKSTGYEIGAGSDNGLHKRLVAATPGTGKNFAQACLTFSPPMARAPTLSYYGNGNNLGSASAINIAQQNVQIAVETLYANESMCIFANSASISNSVVCYKLHFAADAEILL